MTYKYSTLFKWINILVDYLILNLALIIGLNIEWPDQFDDFTSNLYQFHFLLVNFFWFFCTTQVRLYKNVMTKKAIPSLQLTIFCLFIFLLASLGFDFSFPQFSYSTNFIVKVFLLFSTVIIIWKVTFLGIRKSRRRFWLEYKKIVILGAGQAGTELYDYFKTNPHLGYIVSGIFDDSFSKDALKNQNLSGKLSDCFSFALSNGVTEIFSALPANDLNKVKMLMQEADHHMIRFRLVPHIKSFLDKNVFSKVLLTPTHP